MEIVVKTKKGSGVCCATFQKTHVGHPTCHEAELRYTKQHKRRKSKGNAKAIIDVSENIILTEQESSDSEQISTKLVIFDGDVQHFEKPSKEYQFDVESFVAENLNYVFFLKPGEDKDVESNEENDLIRSKMNGANVYERIGKRCQCNVSFKS